MISIIIQYNAELHLFLTVLSGNHNRDKDSLLSATVELYIVTDIVIHTWQQLFLGVLLQSLDLFLTPNHHVLTDLSPPDPMYTPYAPWSQQSCGVYWQQPKLCIKRMIAEIYHNIIQIQFINKCSEILKWLLLSEPTHLFQAEFMILVTLLIQFKPSCLVYLSSYKFTYHLVNYYI